MSYTGNCIILTPPSPGFERHSAISISCWLVLMSELNGAIKIGIDVENGECMYDLYEMREYRRHLDVTLHVARKSIDIACLLW